MSYSDERLQARIEFLEKERVDLSLQLHQRDEKERSKNMYIKSLEAIKDELEESTRIAKREASILRTQKESLDIEVGQLTAQLELQKSKTAASDGLWAKLTLANREKSKAEEELNTNRNELEAVQDQNASLETELEELRQQLVDSKALNARYEHLEIEGRSYVAVLQSKVSAAEQVISDLHGEIEELKATGDEERSRFENEQLSMQSDLSMLTDKVELLEKQAAEQEKARALAMVSMAHGGGVIDGDAAKIIAELKGSLQASEEKRRKLHNTLQELRGNIRVFVRCRPFLRGDEEEKDLVSVDSFTAASAATVGGSIKFNEDNMSLSISNIPGTSVMTSGRAATTNNFTFDHVFKPTVNQQDVFNEVSDYVQSALDGYRICIFSYGQTGSGKTHTMTGGRDEHSRGITPRSVEQIIKQVLVMKEQGWEVSLMASMIELYNE
jgi:kinesin family protein C1